MFILIFILFEIGFRFLGENKTTPDYWPQKNKVFSPPIKKNVVL